MVHLNMQFLLQVKYYSCILQVRYHPSIRILQVKYYPSIAGTHAAFTAGAVFSAGNVLPQYIAGKLLLQYRQYI